MLIEFLDTDSLSSAGLSGRPSCPSRSARTPAGGCARTRRQRLPGVRRSFPGVRDGTRGAPPLSGTSPSAPEREAECPLRHEAQVDVHQVSEAADHQAATDQQHDRERHLGGDEQPGGVEGTPVESAGGAAAAKGGGHRETGRNHRGCDTDAHRDESGDSDGEHKGCRVEPHGRERRDRGRSERREAAEGTRSEKDSTRRTGEREQGTVEQVVDDELAGAGAQRSTHREIHPPADRLEEQERGGVRAREEQDASAGNGERLKGVPRARADIVIDDWDDPGRVADLGNLVLDRKAPRDGGEVRLGGLALSSVLQTPEYVQHAKPSEFRRGPVVATTLGVERGTDRRPQVGAAGEIESSRHYADDRERRVAARDRPADDVRITAVPTLPQTVAQDDDAPGCGLVVFGDERAPVQRLCA